MRFLTVLSIAALASACLAQTETPAAPPPSGGVHPDVVVYLRRHALGADLVDISMVEPNYPADLLTKQVNDLCSRLNFPARGLAVYNEEMTAKSNRMSFLHANFATAGLTSEDGSINLTPLIQAFAGAPAPYTIKGMTVILDDFSPTPKTLKDYQDAAVSIRSRIDTDPPDVEYDVQILNQNPGEIQVKVPGQSVEQKTQPAARRGPNVILVGSLIVLAGLAAGALVYFLVVHRLSGNSPSAAARKS